MDGPIVAKGSMSVGRIDARAAADSAAAQPRRLAVTYGFLLGLYLAVPLCVAAQVLDAVWWGGALRLEPLSERSPTVWAFIGMGLPHIIASSVLLTTNLEYRRAFRGRTGATALSIGAFFVLAALIPYDVSFALLSALTVAHVFHQQMGIGKGICRCEAVRYSVWTWTSIALGVLLYDRIYLGDRLPPAARVAADVGLVALGIAFLGLSVLCHRRIGTARGRWFLWANTAMVLAGVHLYFVGWSFLAALAPRIVHDMTAFGFYAVHDHNRHAASPRNLLFRLTSRARLGALWVAPAVGLALTAALSRWGETALRAAVGVLTGTTPTQPLVVYVVVFLMLMHYSTEAVTWKKGSPYRQFVSVDAG